MTFEYEQITMLNSSCTNDSLVQEELSIVAGYGKLHYSTGLPQAFQNNASTLAFPV